MSSIFYQHVGNMFVNMLSICYQYVYKCVNENEISASVQVEAGSNNVLGLIGVVGAALLGASFLQEKKQQPVANSPSDVSFHILCN